MDRYSGDTITSILQINAFTDIDNDGLVDGLEYLKCLDALEQDSDGDGLLDGNEETQNRNPNYKDHPNVEFNLR